MRAEDVLKRYKDEDVVDFLELPLTDVNQRGHHGTTPLHIASTRGDIEEVEALLAAGAKVNVKGESGYTPLHDAAGHGDVAVVKRLLAAGASLDITNDNGHNPRQVAVLLDRYDVVAAIDEWEKRKA
jgi:ankyrin repeat protein